ncbi:ABC transporter ATP-binding protein [Streptomyces inhibens]|uniref:ABC transporter ATP-binding protein n=1 Tax=Streptomyces inhibens TaxID=2293571 RepID=UPI00402A9274
MDGGHLVECGPTDRVLERPEHPTTRNLISCLPTLPSPRRRHDPTADDRRSVPVRDSR